MLKPAVLCKVLLLIIILGEYIPSEPDVHPEILIHHLKHIVLAHLIFDRSFRKLVNNSRITYYALSLL